MTGRPMFTGQFTGDEISPTRDEIKPMQNQIEQHMGKLIKFQSPEFFQFFLHGLNLIWCKMNFFTLRGKKSQKFRKKSGFKSI